MRIDKTEIIIGAGVFIVALAIVGGGLWWRYHGQQPARLSENSSKATSSPDTSLNQNGAGGLNVSGQASDLGQLGNNGSGNGQAQGGQTGTGDSRSSDRINPSSFDASNKYLNSKDALFRDIQKGTGAQLAAGHNASIYYKVWLTNGALVDHSPVSSGGQPQPYSFTLGAHQVIPGLEEGVYGMKVGGQRLVIVPPSVGYGPKGQGSVPPNSVMVFQVQLVNVK